MRLLYEGDGMLVTESKESCRCMQRNLVGLEGECLKVKKDPSDDSY